MNLVEYVRLLRRRWLVLVLLALLGLGASAGWLLTQVPRYTATTSTYISVAAASNVSDAASGVSLSQTAAKNFATIATSPYVLNRVVSDLQLATPASQLGRDVQATALLDTSVVSISASADSPSAAAAIANTVAVELADAVARLNPNVGNGASLVRATQMGTALPPARPSSPNIPIDLALGLLAGLALAVVGVVTRDALDRRAVGAQELAETTGLPVLGTIPDVRSNGLSSALDADTAGVLATAFLALRTKLQYMPTDHRLRALVVASPDEGEVAGNAAAQLAESFAHAGQRVLVIDARPMDQTVSRFFGVQGQPGLIEGLSMRAEVRDMVHASLTPNIWVMPAGRPEQSFSEAIRSESASDLLRELQRLFDIVLIAPDPLLGSQDGALLARLTDGALVVCRNSHTTPSDARSAVGMLEGLGARGLGLALLEPLDKRFQAGRSSRRHRGVSLAPTSAVSAS